MIEPRQIDRGPDEEEIAKSPKGVFTDIAGFAQRLSDSLFNSRSDKRPPNKVFTPFPGASCEVIRRSSPVKKRKRRPAYEAATPDVPDSRADRGLVYAGVAVLTLAFIGVGAMVSSTANRSGMASSPAATARTSSEPEQRERLAVEPGEPSKHSRPGTELVLTSPGEPE